MHDSPFDKIAADKLAYECSRLIDRGVLDSRSGVADALLNYLNVGGLGGPSTVPQWQEEYLQTKPGSGNRQ